MLTRLLNDSSATSAVEFSLIAPILIGLLGASVDIGTEIRIKYKLTSSLANAADYALIHATQASSQGAAALAAATAALAASSYAANWADTRVEVNNGATATVTSGVAAASGTASNAESTYCPTGSGATFAWGSATTSTCSNSAAPGKYIVITASKSFTPLILPTSLTGTQIGTTMVAQLQ